MNINSFGDQVDASQFRNILDKEKEHPYEGHRDVRVCLYHLELGVDAQGSDPIDIQALEKDPQFIKMKMQAKFLAGYVTYSDAEKKALHEWIENKGATQLYSLFFNVVLNNQPTQREAFVGSELANILEQRLRGSARPSRSYTST